MTTLAPLDVIEFDGLPTVVVRHENLPMSQMREFMDSAFGTLGAAIGAGVFQPTGPAFSLYEDMPGETITLEVGFPVAQPLDGEHEGVTASSLPACTLAITKYTGPYDGLGEAWGQFLGLIAGAGYAPGFPFWEAYDTEPTPDTDPNTLITGLAVPVAKVATEG